MYSKRMTVIVLTLLVGLFALFLLFNWHSNTSHKLFKGAAEAIVIALGYVGFNELDRVRHWRVRRVIRYCFILWIVISFILFGLTRFYHTNGFDWVLNDSLYLFWILFAAQFPFALYLNRRQNKSTPQPTIDNAN